MWYYKSHHMLWFVLSQKGVKIMTVWTFHSFLLHFVWSSCLILIHIWNLTQLLVLNLYFNTFVLSLCQSLEFKCFTDRIFTSLIILLLNISTFYELINIWKYHNSFIALLWNAAAALSCFILKGFGRKRLKHCLSRTALFLPLIGCSRVWRALIGRCKGKNVRISQPEAGSETKLKLTEFVVNLTFDRRELGQSPGEVFNTESRSASRGRWAHRWAGRSQQEPPKFCELFLNQFVFAHFHVKTEAEQVR